MTSLGASLGAGLNVTTGGGVPDSSFFTAGAWLTWALPKSSTDNSGQRSRDWRALLTRLNS
jgi:hypothetical protein